MKKLEKNQMELVNGGKAVSKEEYCATARMIIDNNEVSDAIKGYVNYLCM